MRLHVSGNEKEVLLDVVHKQGLTASRAMAYIIKQWTLSESRKKENNESNITRSKEHQS